MGQTQCLKVLLADKKQGRIVDRRCRRRIASAIENRKLSNRTTRTINTEYLLSPACRAFENSAMARLDHIESRTRLTLAKYAFACRVVTRNCTLRKKTQFALRQTGEDRHLREGLANCERGFRHDGYCTGARCGESAVSHRPY